MPRQENGDERETRVQVGARVRELRLHRGMTQAQLTQASGLSRGYLSSIERARVNAKMSPMYRIAAALDVVPMFMFTGDDELSREFDHLRFLPAREATRVLQDLAKESLRSLDRKR